MITAVHLEFLREVYWQKVTKEVMCHKERVLDSPKQAITPQGQLGIQKSV